MVANDMPPRSMYGAGRNRKVGSRARLLAALDSRHVTTATCGHSWRDVLNVGAAGRPERSRHEPPNGRDREARRHHPEEARICCRRILAALDSRQVVKAACGYSSRNVLNVAATEGPERTRHEPPGGRVREARRYSHQIWTLSLQGSVSCVITGVRVCREVTVSSLLESGSVGK